MMSEKRFEVVDNSFSMWIVDTTLKEDRHEGNIYTAYEMCHKLNELCEENEQLRKTMNEVIELLVEEVDLFSDKATEHDIIAYTELQSFDNKDAYYIATATKKAIKILQGVLNE